MDGLFVFLARWSPSRFVLFGLIRALIGPFNFTHSLVSQSVDEGWRETDMSPRHEVAES
jgi:hypothetical protein